ncbi:DUF2612 domain-containing protein [Bombella sp. TMW 2.2559]|uniref:DUF2612 domain-containing protein n=1 Tax=Bombella dulcis TaxID=2967339 RepID=A0ABT3WGV6_9PROT|nr:DUF2612 domain-containing protein [Bombella dulcis]MCX5617042.1 DUF2612 domain-containing protein [Bombella dulcis]
MIDIRETILAQYANSPALTGIIGRFNAAADPQTMIELFLKNVWDPTTATGWGLDVWGRIVGVQRVQKVSQPEFFGFDEAEDGSGSARPFEDGIFYAGKSITENYALTDEAFRKLIFAKAAANISNGSIADINRILMQLFGGDGRLIYISEGTAANDYFGFSEARLDKDTPKPFDDGVFFAASSLGKSNGTMTISHNWDLSPLDVTLIRQSGALPRPAGVHILYQRVDI